MTTDTGTTLKVLGNNTMFKVERKPSRPEAVWYEVMLSPFKTLLDAPTYIEKYKQYYPVEDRVYKITELDVVPIK
jgi:hypothetical protein